MFSEKPSTFHGFFDLTQAAAATKKASRFTFMGMGRKKWWPLDSARMRTGGWVPKWLSMAGNHFAESIRGWLEDWWRGFRFDSDGMKHSCSQSWPPAVSLYPREFSMILSSVRAKFAFGKASDSNRGVRLDWLDAAVDGLSWVYVWNYGYAPKKWWHVAWYDTPIVLLLMTSLIHGFCLLMRWSIFHLGDERLVKHDETTWPESIPLSHQS